MKVLLSLFVLIFFVFSSLAFATVESANVANFTKLSIPFTESHPDNTVGNDTFQVNRLFAFDEDQNIVLDRSLFVDIKADGNGGGKKRGAILKGTTVASHYIVFDPADSTLIRADITFDSNVLGIITNTRSLKASDILANTSVTYLNPSARGLESDKDNVSISGKKTVRISFRANSPGDFIRVLTEYSPGAVFVVPD